MTCIWVSRAFTFKQFSVAQDRAAFKVGTDSVILGAWAETQNAGHLLDIGTGTGLLALMCAQRNPHASVTAIDKDPESAAQAIQNFAASPWAHRLTAVENDLADYETHTLFDYIICNPPYFLQALLPPDGRKANARHAHGEWFALLARKVNALANPTATFGCVLPTREFDHLQKELAPLHWHVARQQTVLPYPDGEKTRMLAEWKKDYTSAPAELPPLYVRDENREYSEAYKRLTAAFYLGF